MTHAEINNAINQGMATGSTVALNVYAMTDDEVIDLIREVWLVDADGEPMPRTPECDIDYALLAGEGPDGQDVLNVWGWSHEAREGEQDWRLRVPLTPSKICDRCERALPEGEYVIDGLCEECQAKIARADAEKEARRQDREARATGPWSAE